MSRTISQDMARDVAAVGTSEALIQLYEEANAVADIALGALMMRRSIDMVAVKFTNGLIEPALLSRHDQAERVAALRKELDAVESEIAKHEKAPDPAGKGR